MTQRPSVFFANFHSRKGWMFLPYQWGLMRAAACGDEAVRRGYVFRDPFLIPSQSEDGSENLYGIEAPFVLAVSCYMWSFAPSMELCQSVKRRWPECRIVAGGPSVPNPGTRHYDSFFIRYPYVDVLVHGFGEVPFRELLREYLNGTPDLTRVSSLTLNLKGRPFPTPRAKYPPGPISDGEIPSPYLAGYFDSLAQGERTPGKSVNALLETNRGCPHKCTFCLWGLDSSKIQTFGIDRVAAEIDWMGKNQIETILVADANFGILPRDVEIARCFAETKEKYGWPRLIHFLTAKKKPERVFEISKILDKADLLRGATLSVQSMNKATQVATRRVNVGAEQFKSLMRRYKAERMPVYTDLILPLPAETKDSWMHGICELMEWGQHDDIRVFDYFLLPNTESDSTEYRNRYGLRTRFKDTHLDREEASRHGAVELVYETNTMSYDDWLHSRVFADCALAMHNGGYTRFLAIYLHNMGLHSYYDFYTRFFDHFFFLEQSHLGPILRDSQLRYCDIVESVGPHEVPAALFANGHPKLHEQLKPYISDKKSAFYPCEYIWIRVNERLDRFYEEVGIFLRDVLGVADGRLASLLGYQKDIMLVPSYDPQLGKSVSYSVDWPAYFFGDGKLREEAVDIRYTDVAMGVRHQDPLPPPGDVAGFAAAAVGWVWPLGRYRRFFHQPETLVRGSGG